MRMPFAQAIKPPRFANFFFFLVKKKDIKNVRLKTKFFQNFLYLEKVSHLLL